MKLRYCLCFAAGLLLAGCGEKADKPAASTNTSSSGNPLTAPADYLNAAVKAKQTAVKTIDTTSLDKALQMFNVEQGRYPKDLNELVEKKYIPQIPTPPFGTKLVYDAGAGTVKVEKQP